jgi:hypothetical protein
MVKAKSHNEAKQISLLSESEMRFRIIDIAEKDPESVMRPINSKADRYKFALHYAASVGTIELNESINVLKWPNGDIFASGKQGINVIDYFVTLAQGDIEAGDLMDKIILLSKVKFPDDRPVEAQIAEPTGSKPNYAQKKEENQDWVDKWIYAQIDAGKIATKGPKYFPYPEDDKIHTTHNAFKEALQKDGLKLFNELNAKYYVSIVN